MSDIKSLFTDITADAELANQVDKVIKWKLEAKTDEEKRQADIAFDILTRDIPLMIKCKNGVRKEKILEIIEFGLQVAKLILPR